MKTKSYNRSKELQQAKTDACGSKEPGLHPTVDKPRKPLRESDRRIILEKLCSLHSIPPREDRWSFLRFDNREAVKLEKEYGYPLKYLEDWSGFTEYFQLWREAKREFVKKHYRGK